MVKKYLFAIESSCDETAISLVDMDGSIVKEIISSQSEIHKQYGGVIPEIASRNHVVDIQVMAQDMLNDIDRKSIAVIVVTAGPGLIGSVLVGLMFGKGLAHGLDIPLIAVNHLEGHILSPRIANGSISRDIMPFPFLSLLISGGHCQLVGCYGLGDYEIFGESVDDAVGEAFDKTARLLGLGYPGGVEIQQKARFGNRSRFVLPIAFRNDEGCNMSFSGLKTAVLRYVELERQISGELDERFICDMSASLQYTITETLKRKIEKAMKIFSKKSEISQRRFAICGGVAANTEIRSMIELSCKQNEFSMHMPEIKYCTDNATMIAAVGMEYYQKGIYSSLDFIPRSQWKLSDLSK